MASQFPSQLDSWGDVIDNTSTVYALHVNDLRDAVEHIEAKLGRDNAATTSTIDYKVNKFFTSGRKVWLYENTAPTGWTIATSVGDKLIAVKGGSDAYNVSGGTMAGTWNVTGLASHNPHTHQWHKGDSGQAEHSRSRTWSSDGTTEKAVYQTNYQEEHGLTVSIQGADGRIIDPDYPTQCALYVKNNATQGHTFDGDWRPYAAVGIVASKT